MRDPRQNNKVSDCFPQNELYEPVLIVYNLQTLLDKCLLPNASSIDGQVFYLKMKGDYYRYESEYASGDRKKGKTAQTQFVNLGWASFSPNQLRLGFLSCYRVPTGL